MYLFSQILNVFLDVFKLPSGEMQALRGRLQNYQKLGIVKYANEKGKRVRYSRHDIYKWAFCLEFAEFGIDPKIIADLISLEWPQINKGFYHTYNDDWFAHFRPAMLHDRRLDRITNLGFILHVCQERNVEIYFEKLRSETPPGIDDQTVEEFRVRHASTNISHIRRKIDDALRALDLEAGKTAPATP